MAKFKPGESGNPKGKPKGAVNRRTQLAKLLEPHANELIEKLILMAKSGDMAALKICIDKLLPKAVDDTVCIEGLEGSYAEKAEKVIQLLAEGQITPVESNNILTALTAQFKLLEADELISRITKLEKLNANKNTR